ncbi:MAG: hypothetical protein ACE5KV_02605 [Thermoplasmata archaeon]
MPNPIWATRVAGYILGTDGVPESRFNALGFHLNNHTRLGDDNSELLLGFSVLYEVLPPENLTARVQGLDVVLEWAPSRSTGIDYYRIYGGPSPRALNLYNLMGFTQPGSSSTSWVHSYGAQQDEYYYVVRAYNMTYGLESYTSNTAGIFALRFGKGRNAFSLPLKPSHEMRVSDLMDNLLGSTAVYWMDSAGHWIAYGGAGSPDPVAEIGHGYMVELENALRLDTRMALDSLR